VAASGSNSRIFLISSVLLGVVAMVAAFVWLETNAGQDRGPKTVILVAKQDLRSGTALDPAKDLVELEIPAKLIELKSRGLTPDARDSYKGQRLNRDVLAGTPVLLADLAPAATLELRGDSRALSIQVKGSSALGGLLIPGDYIKVLVTRPKPASRPTTLPADPDGYVSADAAAWETVIVSPQAFRVIAVNQRLSRSRTQLTAADQYKSASESTAQQTVTLEVTEAQAQTVLEQTGGGQLPITLLLCPAPAATPP